MSFHDHEGEEYNKRFGVHERQKAEQKKKAEVNKPLPNEIDLNKLRELLMFSDRYEISIQFWPDQIAVYIMKDFVDLADFGGSFDFAIEKSISYLRKINPTNP